MKNVNWTTKNIETIEKVGDLKKPKTFNNKFNELQIRIINLLKYNPDLCTTDGKIDYGKIYLRLLSENGNIKIISTERLISPESPDRILRKLMEYATYNKDLEFLLKFKKDNNLDLDSRDYYRNN